jgi:hypothetical protein
MNVHSATTRRGLFKAALAAAAAVLIRRPVAAAPVQPPDRPRKPIRWIGHG